MKRFILLFICLVCLAFLISCETKEESKKEEAKGGVVVIGEAPKSPYNGIEFNKKAYNFCLKTFEEGKEKTVCLNDILERKKIVLIFFGYTHCPDVCPAAMYVLQKAMNELSEIERKQVQVVFISVDPERDNPKVVSDYAKFFDKSFLGLTGTPEEIKEVAKKYMVFYEKVKTQSESGYLVNHTASIYLITKEGLIKIIYPSRKQKPNLIAEDIKKLLKS